jgi:threonine dehydratase
VVVRQSCAGRRCRSTQRRHESDDRHAVRCAALKVDNTRQLGAEIVFYDRRTEDREQIARDLAAKSGAVIVPSYDDPDIIAGQGTVALEFVEQAAGTRHDARCRCSLPAAAAGSRRVVRLRSKR